MDNWTEEEFSEYVKEVSAAYWAEIEELKIGMHPTQNESEE